MLFRRFTPKHRGTPLEHESRVIERPKTCGRQKFGERWTRSPKAIFQLDPRRRLAGSQYLPAHRNLTVNVSRPILLRLPISVPTSEPCEGFTDGRFGRLNRRTNGAFEKFVLSGTNLEE